MRWLALLAAVLLAYAPALFAGFVWDDGPLVERNPLIRSHALVGEAFRHRLFVENPAAAHYRPLQTLTLLADYACWELNPFGFHLTNVVLQALAAGLLYSLLRRLLLTPGLRPTGASDRGMDATAFAIALLWAVHPAHNAAVAYVAGRADPLSFSLAAAGWLLLFPLVMGPAPASRSRRILGAALGALALLAALFSRESAACWVVLAASGIFLLGGARGQPTAGRWLALGALAAAVGGYLCVRTYCLIPEAATAGTVPAAPVFDPGARVLLALHALATDGMTWLWPARLLMDRTLGIESALLAPPGGADRLALWWAPATLAGAALLVGLIGGAVFQRGRGWRLRRFGAWWFLVGILPVSNLVPLNATVADHWLYLPGVGLLLVMAGWWQELPGPVRRFAVPAVAMAALLLTGRTAWRSRDWRDAGTFYARTIADGGNSARMRFNLAHTRLRAGDLAGAEATLANIRGQFPEFFPARLLADGLEAARRGEDEAARAERLTAWREHLPAGSPSEPALTAELARTLLRAGRTESALALTTTSATEPGARSSRWQPFLALHTESLWRAGRPAEARAITTTFVRSHPWHQEAAFRLADLQTATGDDAAALSTLSQADGLDVHGTEALERMAAIYVRRGDLPRALACQQAAVAVAPGRAEPHRRLGVVHALLHQETEARREIALAERLPTFPGHILHPDSPSLAGGSIPGAIPPVRGPSPSVSSSPSSQATSP